MNFNHQIILGSKSPRRRELLGLINPDFKIRAIETDENFPAGLEPKKVATYIAQQKAKAQYPLDKNEILITSDTTVISDHEVLAKPASKEEAVRMLERLSGKSHLVNTAVCISTTEQTKCISEFTEVFFPKLTSQQIADYIERFQPYDKAGAYGIQECTENVKGLLSDEELIFLENSGQLSPFTKRDTQREHPAFIISQISGPYFNVVGLPVVSLEEALTPFEIKSGMK